MAENIFLARQEPAQLKDYLQFTGGSRGNLGDEVPVSVYRMLEYSLKEELRHHRNSRHPSPPLTAEEVLQRADTKMYRQKQSHRADYVGKL